MNTAILLSGGIDSTALTFWKKPDIAITIDYGQKASQAEIRASAAITKSLKIPHEIIQIDCSSLGSGDLSINHKLDIAPVSEWWPYRNQLLITLACMKLISFGIAELIIGTVATDNVHKDGTPAFYDLMDQLMLLQEGAITITTPAINLTSTELVRQSKIPLEFLGWTHSCHKYNYACGQCSGCMKHLFTLQQLNYE